MSYRNVATSYGSLIDTATQAGVEQNRRSHIEEMHRLKSRQRGAMFGSLAQLVGIGSNLYDIYNENKELIKTGRKYGFEPTGSKFNRIFGTPSFEREGEVFKPEDVMAVEYYDRYGKQKNLLDAIFPLRNEEESFFDASSVPAEVTPFILGGGI